MRSLPLGTALGTAALLTTATLQVSHAAPTPAAAGPEASFTRTATYPVYLNAPAEVDPAAETVAEIATVSADGKTLIYSDAPGKRIGFVDISSPGDPVGLESIDLAAIGHADDQPTSVAVRGGYVLVSIDESGGDFANPAGRLDVIRVSDRELVKSIDLGGQPDSIAISPDKSYAAIAMENQRDEAFTPVGQDEGDLPQLPAGFVQVLDLSGPVGNWDVTPVALTEPDGDPLPALVTAGLNTPEDPEPEYVTINAANKLALTLQENNGVVVIDLPTRTIERAFSAGTASVAGIDTVKDGRTDQTGSITDVAREPDSIAWVGPNHLATANEGDWLGGTRGWTVFDATTGTVLWDAGNELEKLATRVGLHNEARAAKKGVEPEGLAFAEYAGTPYAFVGSERSNFVAVYDMTDPAAPAFQQVLPTSNGPEGLLPIPGRNLLAVSSETDDAGAGVRATIGLYELRPQGRAWPTVESVDVDGAPIGWGALGALSADPTDPTHLYAASDSAYKTGRIYHLDVTEEPALIDSVVEVTEPGGAVPALDVEGLFARPGGGFWVAHEGTTGAANRLIRTDADGEITDSIALPTAITDHVGKWGLEGVTATGTGSTEQVYVALQRPLWTNPADLSAGTVDGADVVRIGRYHVATGTWSWFGYPLEATTTPGDWMGLSEIAAVDDDTLAVIERDKLNGPDARVKRVYTVDVPSAPGASLTVLKKKLARDLLPALRAPKGWIQEKLEGLTVGADGNVYAVTDNDGLKDATGETQFLRLGSARSFFPGPPAVVTARTTTKLTVSRKAQARKRVVLRALVRPVGSVGTVVFKDRGEVVAVDAVNGKGRARSVIRLGKGRHVLRAFYSGSATNLASYSGKVVIRLR